MGYCNAFAHKELHILCEKFALFAQFGGGFSGFRTLVIWHGFEAISTGTSSCAGTLSLVRSARVRKALRYASHPARQVPAVRKVPHQEECPILSCKFYANAKTIPLSPDTPTSKPPQTRILTQNASSVQNAPSINGSPKTFSQELTVFLL